MNSKTRNSLLVVVVVVVVVASRCRFVILIPFTETHRRSTCRRLSKSIHQRANTYYFTLSLAAWLAGWQAGFWIVYKRLLYGIHKHLFFSICGSLWIVMAYTIHESTDTLAFIAFKAMARSEQYKQKE